MKKYTYSGVDCFLNCSWHERNVIYLLKFPAGGLYIGQTTQKIGTRIKQHCIDSFQDRNYRYDNPKNRSIRKYKTFNVDILEKCLSVDQMNKREDEIIKEYKAKGLKLYNTASGGLNNCEYFGIKCVVSDKEFNLIKEFDKIKDARKYMRSGDGNTSVSERYKLINNKYFLFSFNDYIKYKPSEHIDKYNKQVEVYQKKMRLNPNLSRKQYYGVVQVDHRYNVINIMDIHEAMNIYGNSIQSHLGGRRRYVYGYYWMREEEYNKIILQNRPLQSVLIGLKYIYKVNKRKEIVGEYKTIVEASIENKHSIRSIDNNIKLKSYISDEYFFIMSDEYKAINPEYINRITTLEQTSEPKKVFEYDEKGKLINTYVSIKECARLKGVHKNKIRKAVRAGIMYDNKLLTCAV